jgi:flavin-dependent dehydrogenase
VAVDRTEFDIAIVGGGPAGSAAALALGRYTKRRIVMIERSDYGAVRAGESVSSGLAPILAYLGIGDLPSEQGYLAAFGNVAAWGSAAASNRDFLFTAGGHGWLLDRAAFDSALANAAERCGIHVMRSTNVIAATFTSNVWQVRLGDRSAVTAKHIIDATGRRCAIARAAGARRESVDKLVGLVAWLNFAAPAHIQTRTVLIEAAENGWWYSAPVPEGRLVVAYMTDADQLDRALISNTETFLRFVSTAPLTSARVADGVPVTPPRAWLSESAITLPCVGEEWIAAGDAAASFDPLSSLGIGYAMLSGIQAARAVDHRLRGDDSLATAYAGDVGRHVAGYLTQRRELYRLEQRWPDRPFWLRRHAIPRPVLAVTARTLASIDTANRLATTTQARKE